MGFDMIRNGTSDKIEHAVLAGLRSEWGFYPTVRKKVRELLSEDELKQLAVIIRSTLERAPDLDVHSKRG